MGTGSGDVYKRQLFGSVIIFCFILITHIPAVAGFFQSIGLPSFAQIPILEGLSLIHI